MPSISSVSAALVPNAPRNKAITVTIRSLAITASPSVAIDYITLRLAKKHLI
jgi:hypothetical protein